MNMFTHACVRDCISLAVSGGSMPWFVSVCLVSSSPMWDCFQFLCSNFSSLPPRHPALFYCPPFHLRLSVSTLFFSPLWYFPAVWWLSCIWLFHCQFSQTVAYATVCICNLITDAPHWQQVQLCMDLCLSNIPGDIVLCGAEYMNACLCACMRVRERDCIRRPWSCVNTSVLKCVQIAVMVVIINWSKYMYT